MALDYTGQGNGSSYHPSARWTAQARPGHGTYPDRASHSNGGATKNRLYTINEVRTILAEDRRRRRPVADSYPDGRLYFPGRRHWNRFKGALIDLGIAGAPYALMAVLLALVWVAVFRSLPS